MLFRLVFCFLNYNLNTWHSTRPTSALFVLIRRDLNRNQLSQLSPTALVNNTALEELYLHYNRLTSLPTNIFQAQTNLRQLCVCQLTEEDFLTNSS